MKKIISFLKTPIRGLEHYDLTIKYPGYFNKKVFRLMWLCMFVVVGIDFFMNGGSFINYSVSCPEDKVTDCLNPYYKCKEGEFYNCQFQVPESACKRGLCDTQYLPPGFNFGRRDLLHVYGELIILLFVPLAFLLNHIVYLWKVKT